MDFIFIGIGVLFLSFVIGKLGNFGSSVVGATLKNIGRFAGVVLIGVGIYEMAASEDRDKSRTHRHESHTKTYVYDAEEDNNDDDDNDIYIDDDDNEPDDGIPTDPVYRDCMTCNGSGQCIICEGAGTNYDIACQNCYGTGNCPACYGEGHFLVGFE